MPKRHSEILDPSRRPVVSFVLWHKMLFGNYPIFFFNYWLLQMPVPLDCSPVSVDCCGLVHEEHWAQRQTPIVLVP